MRLGVGKLSPLQVLLLYTLPQVATTSLRSTFRVELPLVFWCYSFVQHGLHGASETASRASPVVGTLAALHMRAHAHTLAAMLSGVGPNEISQSSLQVIIHGSSVPTRSLSRAMLCSSADWRLPSTFSRPGHLAKESVPVGGLSCACSPRFFLATSYIICCLC